MAFHTLSKMRFRFGVYGSLITHTSYNHGLRDKRQTLSQVESLSCKAKIQEAKLESISKQLNEAVTIAGVDSSKCEVVKEVIKSLTAQVR